MLRYIPILLFIVLSNCTPRTTFNRTYIENDLKLRTGHSFGSDTIKRFSVPEGVSLVDGLTQKEAVALALFNNAQYQAALYNVYIAEADLIEAGQIKNPFLYQQFPYGTNYFRIALNVPIDFLLQRPKRVAVAKAETERISYSLVNQGLLLNRDVEVSYADLKLAQDRYKINFQNSIISSEFARITQARLKAGEISELETSLSIVDSLRTADQAIRATQDTIAFRYRFNVLIGIDSLDTYFPLTPEPLPNTIPSRQSLVDSALSSHPDIIASRLLIESSGKRIGMERASIFNLIAILNTQIDDANGFTAAPAFQFDLPILNFNRGRIKRAKVLMEQASRQYTASRRKVNADVLEAYSSYLNALKVYQLWQNRLVPEFEKNLELSQKAYLAGGVSYLFVLESMRQYTDAKLRMAEAEAQLRKAIALLNYTAGRKIL